MHKANKPILVKEKEKTIILLLFFPLILMFLFYVVPFVLMVYYSFTNYNGFLPNYDIVGLKNYKDALNIEHLEVFKVSIYYLISAVFQFIIGTYLALFVYFSKKKKVLIVIIILPLFINSVTMGLISILMFKVDGILNNILYFFYSNYEEVRWISDKNIVNYTLATITAWKFTPFTFLIMYAGINSVNKDIIKSSKLFGANKYQLATQIILPNVKLSINICMLMLTVGALTTFEIPIIITKGALGTKTILIHIHEVAFNMRNYGLASVITLIVICIILIISIVLGKVGRAID